MKLRIFKIAIVVILIGLAGSNWRNIKVLSKQMMPIRYVRVSGVYQYLSKDEVRRVLRPVVATDFFSLNLQQIQQAVLPLPWVSTADVNRVWPDAIEIRVYEQKPRARWGAHSLLNTQGQVFTPSNIDQFKALPLIMGPSGNEYKLLEIMKGLETVLMDQSLALATFTVSGRRSWKIVLQNGMELQLGRTKPLRNFQRFMKALPLLGKERIQAIAKVDMRYPNGFAVLWKPETEMNWQDIDNSKSN